MLLYRTLQVVCVLGLGAVLAGCFTERGKEGKLLYGRHCSSCHLENGEGLRGVIPPLADSDYLDKHREELACLIRNGLDGPIQVNGRIYNQAMPGNRSLSEADITNILNYLHQEFKSPATRVSLAEVKRQLQNCP
ncbi:c-type cytochrome [Nibribacter ruber]|uniref:C-type cytochrome n=1 Tax=Nibribacter ruber TaxID=2698458 RepID=A0A6P1P4G0_9BACT|nr:cytochrome c [Nibribacter ruber]QHL89208.1 c-type cytochrome [Nibribacter ruber]